MTDFQIDTDLAPEVSLQFLHIRLGLENELGRLQRRVEVGGKGLGSRPEPLNGKGLTIETRQPDYMPHAAR